MGLVAGIETGGTKVVCAVARTTAPGSPIVTERFPTTDPAATIERIVGFLQAAAADEPLQALGLASFGPVLAAPGSEGFGTIGDTPKAGWSGVDLLRRVNRDVIPAAFVSDVLGAAVGELRFGAGRGVSSLAYATVGTGIGVGLIIDERPLIGNSWPELGHLLVRRHPADRFEGTCPFHGDCLEGLAAGPAVMARWGTDASSFAREVQGEAYEILSFYIAQLAYSVLLATGVERVVIGGGVLSAPGLLAAVHETLARISGGYGPAAASARAEQVLVAPGCGELSGVVGALALASDLAGAPRETKIER